MSPPVQSRGDGAPRVAVWRDVLLPPSETFIVNQVQAMHRWTPRLVGKRRVATTLPVSESFTLDSLGRRGTLELAAMVASGWSPSLVRELSGSRLVHAHFGPDGANVLRSAQRARTPLLVSFHGYDASAHVDELPRHFRRRWPALTRYASRLVAVSDFVAGQLVERGAPPEKVVVHHIGIPVPPLPPEQQRAGVVFVGRLVEKKGCADLLDAVAALPPDLRGTTLTVVGDGPLRPRLVEQAARLGLAVQFTGIVAPDVVHQHLARAAVFCVPSRRADDGDAEGFGMVFLEAAAAELPVVTYRSGGTPSAVAEGVTGLLVDERDLRGLSAALATLLADPARALAFGRAGRERVEQHFDVVAQTALLEGIYDEVSAGA